MENRPVSIAILVLAHKNLGQLTRLIAHLQSDFDLYVHLDRRSELEVSDFAGYRRTTVIKRFVAGWGSLGIVRSTLELLSLAAGTRKYDRFVLISGLDIPLASNASIQDFFARKPRVDFLESRAFEPMDESRLTRISRFHFFSRKGVRGATTRWAADASRRIDQFLALIGIRREMKYPFRWGSQWMDLRSETVEGILSFIGADPGFLKRFRFTFCPDEVFFQTAIAALGNTRGVEAPLRFIDWESGPEHPRVLRMEDLPRLQKSNMLFARKCDETVDGELVDTLFGRLDGQRGVRSA